MNSILQYVLGFLISLLVGFLIAWGIVEAWVLFWDFGWIWNTLTVPPLVLWNIFAINLIPIFIVTIFTTPLAFTILVIWTN